MPPRVAYTDLEMLDILDRFERRAESATEIARVYSRIKRRPISRSSILGLAFRIRADLTMHDLTPERNGEMHPRWWERAHA